jgi:ribonuclease BN (tRNA processing enzyme)
LSQLGIKGITKIFVTHLHADHVVGLLGIVLMKEMLAKDHGGRQGKHTRGGDDESRRKGGGSARLKLELYGPVGLFNYVAMNLALTCSKIRNIDLIVHELIRDDNRHQTRHDRQDHGRRKSHNHNHNRMTNILHRTYPELIHKNANAHNIQHKKIYQNKLDQTWTIQTPRTLQHDSVPTGGKHADQYLSIQAAEVLHQPGIQTFGYVVREPTPTPKIDVQKAKDLGIRPSAKYRSLKNGFKVMNDDGSREVLPEEVLDGESASATKGRTLAILGDAWKVPNPMKRLAFGADVLVHEATLSKTLEHRSRQRGHSTAGMAGRVAKELQCKILVMNHISGRMDGNGSRSGSGSRNGDNSNDNAKANAYADDEGVDTLLEEAVSSNGDMSDILVAHDFMMVQIPKRSSK